MAQHAAIPVPAVPSPVGPSDEEIESFPKCSHHWVIQPADGPVSMGACQLCSEVREFKNYVEAGPWGDTRQSGRASDADNETDTEEVPIAVPGGLDEEE